MKKLGLTLVVALAFSASVFANGANENGEKWDGTINKGKLTKYLKLTSAQHEEVANICDYFEEQMKSANKDSKNSNEKVRKAVYGNLKLMKKTLTEEQYTNYLRLMAMTLHNKGIDINSAE
ncbi:hypothetical protein [uncultured Bacteroides sp.]|uniref:hypothetical protein n=1 Tax=uncultured Bacteroides sp. TaxID=162156 RepID=UPI00262B2EA4|nr:hypothetical protein [uncultured Bacteroides sp.]